MVHVALDADVRKAVPDYIAHGSGLGTVERLSHAHPIVDAKVFSGLVG